MDLFTNLALGFGVAFTPINLMYAFGGCLLAGAGQAEQGQEQPADGELQAPGCPLLEVQHHQRQHHHQSEVDVMWPTKHVHHALSAGRTQGGN